MTPLQASRLFLGCSPYMPDFTQLCRLLEWQQQQRWGGSSDHGHLLAGSPHIPELCCG
jgi:hypothetical protein